jgi:hypothetical protein
MRHDVHDYLFFDDHRGPVHAEEAGAAVTIAAQPVVVDEGVRHRHLDPIWTNAADVVDMTSHWITKQIDKDRVVLIRAPGQIEIAVMFAAAVLLDAGLTVDNALAVATPPTVELPAWIRKVLI